MTDNDAAPDTQSLARLSWRYVPVGLALFALQLDFFSLSLALPTIATDLNVPVTDLQWLLAGYLLSIGATFVPAGKLGDLAGRRRVLMIGLIVFGATSLVCALSSVAPMLIVFRVLQGIGAGLIMPNAFSLMGATIPEAHRAKVMGLMLGLSGTGTALGPVVGGVLAASAGWQWVFLLNIPVVVIAMIGAVRVPESFADGARRSVRHLDWLGAALIVAGLALTSIGIDNTSNLGLTAPLTWAPFAAGIALLAWFVLHARRVPEPLVRPALLKNRPFMFLLLAGTALNIGLNVYVFVATVQLQTVEHFGAAQAGIVFMLASVGLALCGPVAGWLTAKVGAEWVLTGGLVLGAGSIVLIAYAPNLPVYVIGLGIAGFTCGMGFSVSQIGAQAVLPASQAGEGSALLLTAIVAVGGIAVVIAGAAIEAISGSPTTASLRAVLLGIAALLAAAGVVTLVTALRPRRAAQAA